LSRTVAFSKEFTATKKRSRGLAEYWPRSDCAFGPNCLGRHRQPISRPGSRQAELQYPPLSYPQDSWVPRLRKTIPILSAPDYIYHSSYSSTLSTPRIAQYPALYHRPHLQRATSPRSRKPRFAPPHWFAHGRLRIQKTRSHGRRTLTITRGAGQWPPHRARTGPPPPGRTPSSTTRATRSRRMRAAPRTGTVSRTLGPRRQEN
jgi:hypothetical protein